MTYVMYGELEFTVVFCASTIYEQDLGYEEQVNACRHTRISTSSPE